VASYFAHAEGLSSIVLRIGSYDVKGDPSNWMRQQPSVRHLSGYVSERDLKMKEQKSADNGAATDGRGP